VARPGELTIFKGGFLGLVAAPGFVCEIRVLVWIPRQSHIS
jgi:hypothetical protein